MTASVKVFLTWGAAVALLATCSPPAICQRGQPVTIPGADSSDPALIVDFLGRGGALTRITAGVSHPYRIPMPEGVVNVTALAQDPEGVRKVAIVIKPITCTTARVTGQTTCVSAPIQTYLSEDTGAQGAIGCTARALSTSVPADRTLTTAKDTVEMTAEVLVFGQNFGNRNVNTGWKLVAPLP